MYQWKRFSSLLVVLGLFVTPSHAQDGRPQSPTEPLTLEQALQLAEARSETV